MGVWGLSSLINMPITASVQFSLVAQSSPTL